MSLPALAGGASTYNLHVGSEQKGCCDYKPRICLKILMSKAGQELRAKLEAGWVTVVKAQILQEESHEG